jgi:hypothetical protein
MPMPAIDRKVRRKRAEKARNESNEKLGQTAKKPERILAWNPADILKTYYAEVGADPIRLGWVKRSTPQEFADFLHDYSEKKRTLLVMIRPPLRGTAYFARHGYDNPAVHAFHMGVMAARCKQSWHRPLAVILPDAIAYGFYERRWPVDLDSLHDRLRKDLGIPLGSGVYFPKAATLPLAAALIAARIWRGLEYRDHTSY